MEVKRNSMLKSLRSVGSRDRGVRGLRAWDHIRIRGIPVAARLGRKLGMNWETLGRKFGREVLIAQAGSLNGTASTPAQGIPLDIIFATFQGLNHHVVSVDVVLARALRARGHRIRFVLCDQVLPLCQSKHAGSEERWPVYCGQCFGFADRFIRSAGFEVLRFSELATGKLEAEPRWGAYVESALLKHYRVGTLEENEDVAARRSAFEETAAISASVGRSLVRMNPDRVIMSHGLYCTWGPAREILVESGIPVVTSGPGKKKNTITLNWNVSNDTWDVSNEWNRVCDVHLTTDQEIQLDAYLTSRRRHDQDARVYNFGKEETVAETKVRLSLDPEKTTFTLFTNVLWDAASAQREIAFSNPVEWVIETIAWFCNHPSRQLVVKIHPAEVVIGTKQPFISEISKLFASLPDNVRVIEPHEEVNSWSIIRVTDVGLVHTSTVGLELPLEGVPCVVVSRTHYRGKGFTIDVSDRRHYFELLDSFEPGSFDSANARILARRYAYLLFERYQLPFDFTWEPKAYDVRALRRTRLDELMDDHTVRVIVEAIEKKDELLLPS